MQQIITMVNKPIQAKVSIPGSKSMTNRALLLAALAEGVSELTDILVSDDTLIFIEALQALGVQIELDSDICRVQGKNANWLAAARIWCGEAGTVARFLLAACAIKEGEYHFDGKESLRNRPLAALAEVLQQQGAELNSARLPLVIRGKKGLSGGEIIVPSAETGQFVSALLMIAPFAKTPLILHAQDLVSKPYVSLTCQMMADFGVKVECVAERYTVSLPQHYMACHYKIEPDLSTASYFFAAAAVTGGEMTIRALSRNKIKQGDIVFLNVLEQMGCQVHEQHHQLIIKGPAVLQGLSVDMRDFSDTFMTLASIAPFAQTPTTITHIQHARYKESDRIKAICQGLRRCAVKVDEGLDWIRIYPSQPIAAKIDSFNDHRIAMAFAIIGLRVPGLVIQGAECVTKTCPTFFKLWQSFCDV